MGPADARERVGGYEYHIDGITVSVLHFGFTVSAGCKIDVPEVKLCVNQLIFDVVKN